MEGAKGAKLGPNVSTYAPFTIAEGPGSHLEKYLVRFWAGKWPLMAQKYHGHKYRFQNLWSTWSTVGNKLRVWVFSF